MVKRQIGSNKVNELPVLCFCLFSHGCIGRYEVPWQLDKITIPTVCGGKIYKLVFVFKFTPIISFKVNLEYFELKPHVVLVKRASKQASQNHIAP